MPRVFSWLLLEAHGIKNIWILDTIPPPQPLAVAAYYSNWTCGDFRLQAPIIIMGAALEVGKLTTAVWLHTSG